ncbi:hypothetical protein YC2023_065795 [Brassica napus]
MAEKTEEEKEGGGRREEGERKRRKKGRKKRERRKEGEVRGWKRRQYRGMSEEKEEYHADVNAVTHATPTAAITRL